MADTTAPRRVGLDIQETETNRAIIEAIEQDNEDLEIRHMPGLIKLSAPGKIVINRATIEEKLGRPWETPEFQMAIVTYAGNIHDWDEDHIVIRWDH